MNLCVTLVIYQELFSAGYLESEWCLLYLSLYINAKFLNALIFKFVHKCKVLKLFFARKVLSIIQSV